MTPDQTPYPAPARRLRLGMVGGGGGGLVGEWHWTGARVSNRWDLVAGALSSRPDVARASGRAWLLADDRIYVDYAEMARAEAARPDGIDAVAICTPNHTHRAIAEAFMAQGIDIICDKPMAMTPDDCTALEAMQAQTGVVFAITHPYVFHPMVRQARDMIADGAIGPVRQALIEYAQDQASQGFDADDRKTVWRRDPARSGRTAATGDIGTHAFQLLEYVTQSRVEKLRAEFHVCGGDKPLEDTAFLNLRLAGGAPGSMWVTQAAPGNSCSLSFRIFGQKGGLIWNQEAPEQLSYAAFGAPTQTLYRGHGRGMTPAAERLVGLPRGHSEGVPDAWGNLYTEIAVAVEARRDGRALPPGLLTLPDIHDGTRGVKFIHAAADSHQAGGIWVDLP